MNRFFFFFLSKRLLLKNILIIEKISEGSEYGTHLHRLREKKLFFLRKLRLNETQNYCLD